MPEKVGQQELPLREVYQQDIAFESVITSTLHLTLCSKVSETSKKLGSSEFELSWVNPVTPVTLWAELRPIVATHKVSEKKVHKIHT